MTYEFQLLGLLLLFLLVMVYYVKKDNFLKGNKIYRGILLVTYIIQLIFGGIYILSESGSSIELYSKIYLIMMNLWFGLFNLYFIDFWLKGKKLNNSKHKELLNKFTTIFVVIQIVSGIITIFTKVPLDSYNTINYPKHFITYFISFYLLIEFVLLLVGNKNIKNYPHLMVVFLIQAIMTFLQTRSPEVSFFSVGMILSVFYCYLMLENTDKQELKNVTLERDYAKRQSIDKSNFLKILSHEIRTPLNTIDGFSQIIMESDNLEEIKTDISDIRVASRDLIDVINGMIDLSIIESGNLEIINENYNVYDMFVGIEEIVKSKLRDKNIEFKTEVDDDIPEVLLGDSERLSQVILNLLTNAIKFTDKGTITLKVNSVKSSTKCRLKITVSDTGKGIKKEDLNSIFESKVHKEGATLGLSISKYLLELMGGSIEAESTFGTGSKFIVTLDQKIVSDLEKNKIERKRVLKPFDAKNKRILLVDDNKLNLKVAIKLLQPYNVEVVEVTSGKECLDVLEKDTSFDLILMDDLMPEMSGTECLSILKKIERVDGFYIPVVVLTANAVSGMKEKYLESGFEDYLAKPIDKYELDRILKKYLKGKK